MKIGFIIIARLKSTRLKKKIILKINGKEIIALLIERLKQCEIIDDIIVATSTNPQDNLLCDIAERENVTFFRGDESDVLKRLYDASKKHSLDYIVHITADCPLASFDFVEDVVDLFKDTNADLVTTYQLPHGFFIYGIKPEALKKIIEIKNDSDTEVWLRYFTETGLFKVVDMDVPGSYKRKNMRLSLDYPEDYEFFKELFKKMGQDTHLKSTQEIISFLDENPEIVQINEHCEEKYKKNWEKQNRMKLK